MEYKVSSLNSTIWGRIISFLNIFFPVVFQPPHFFTLPFYNQHIAKSLAMTKLARWFNEVEESGFKSFSTLIKTIKNHYRDILNYFDQRSTNAAAESFNAKIKNFRMQLRGVKDRTFFLFRLAKLFA